MIKLTICGLKWFTFLCFWVNVIHIYHMRSVMLCLLYAVQKTPTCSAFAFNERVEILKSVAETVMFLCSTHDFHLHHLLRCTETVYKTIFYTFGEVIRIVVMCKTNSWSVSATDHLFYSLVQGKCTIVGMVLYHIWPPATWYSRATVKSEIFTGLNFCDSATLDIFIFINIFIAWKFCDNQHVLHCTGHIENIHGMRFLWGEGTHKIHQI